MPHRLVRQPWQTWVVVGLCLWSTQLLYGYAAHLPVFFRADVVTSSGQFAEAVFRLVGLTVLFLGALILVFKKRWALWLAIAGFVLHLAPWAYHYFDVTTSQPEPHLVWHMIKVYPKLTWPTLVVPVAFLVFTVLAARRLSANSTVETDAQQAARGSP